MKKLWNKYKNLFWFFLITLIIFLFVAHYIGFVKVQNSDNYIWGVIVTLDTATAIALAILAVLAYIDYAKGEDEIPVILSVDGKEVKESKLKLLRKYTTRNEVLGILGMIQNDSTGRFDFKYLSNFEFLEQINDVQRGDRDKVIIKLTKKEFIKYFSNFFNTDISDSQRNIEIVFETENAKYKLKELLNIYNLTTENVKDVLEKYLKKGSYCVKINYLRDECFKKNLVLIEKECKNQLIIKINDSELKVFDLDKFEKIA